MNMGSCRPPCKRNLCVIFRGTHRFSYPFGAESLYHLRADPNGHDPAMNAPVELNLEEMLRIRLGVLCQEHRDLDEAIAALQHGARADTLTLRRLKKQKLALKDMIVKLEDQLIPDIIA